MGGGGGGGRLSRACALLALVALVAALLCCACAVHGLREDQEEEEDDDGAMLAREEWEGALQELKKGEGKEKEASPSKPPAASAAAPQSEATQDESLGAAPEDEDLKLDKDDKAALENESKKGDSKGGNGELKGKEDLRKQLISYDADLSVNNPKKSMYQRELERLNRKIAKTNANAKVTFATLLNTYKARKAKTKKDGDDRRKMIINEHERRWQRTSSLLKKQMDKALKDHQEDYKKRVTSFEERAARHLEKLRQNIVKFQQKVEKRKAAMQKKFEDKQKAIKTEHEKRLLEEKKHAAETRSRALNQHAQRVRDALKNAEKIYISARSKADAWLNEKMGFLNSMKKRAMENLAQNKQTLDERAEKIKNELTNANELANKDKKSEDLDPLKQGKEAKGEAKGDETKPKGLIEKEAKKLLDKGQKELVEKYKSKLSESHISSQGSAKKMEELPTWFKKKDEDLKTAYSKAVKDAHKMIGDKMSFVDEEEEEEEDNDDENEDEGVVGQDVEEEEDLSFVQGLADDEEEEEELAFLEEGDEDFEQDDVEDEIVDADEDEGDDVWYQL